jgi:quercetin dioxygenase-like cupin family protein
MKRIAACLPLLLLYGVLQAQEAPPAKQESPAPSASQPIERFNSREIAVVFVRNGEPTPPAGAHITIRDWQIHEQQKIQNFPESGLLIVELHSGKVTTIINGKEERRNPGEFWSVPAGASMSVQVTSESAALHVVAVGKP